MWQLALRNNEGLFEFRSFDFVLSYCFIDERRNGYSSNRSYLRNDCCSTHLLDCLSYKFVTRGLLIDFNNYFLSVKKTGLILLQTVPQNIDVRLLKKKILSEVFCTTYSVHFQFFFNAVSRNSQHSWFSHLVSH